MPLTGHQFLNIDLSFPGVSFGWESWALDSYLNVLEEQIEHARAQYRLRAERELERQSENLEDEEYVYRLKEIEEAADVQIPRFFRIGAVVSIWGIFESYLGDFALYVGKREKVSLSLKDIRADNFRAQIKKYFEKVLRIPIPWSAKEQGCLGQLQKLRHILAHRNGRLMDLSPEDEKKVKNLVARISGVSIEDSTVVVTPEYVTFARDLVYTCVDRFSEQLANKYVGSVPPSDAKPLARPDAPRHACHWLISLVQPHCLNST